MKFPIFKFQQEQNHAVFVLILLIFNHLIIQAKIDEFNSDNNMSAQENAPPAEAGAEEREGIEMMSAEDMPQQNAQSVVISKNQDGAEAQKDGKEGDDVKVLEAKLAARNSRKMNVIKRNSEFFVKNYEVQKDYKRDQMNATDLGEDQHQPKQAQSSKRNIPDLALNDVALAEQKSSDPKSAREEDGAEGLETGYSTARELIAKEHRVQEDVRQDDGSWLPNVSKEKPNRGDLIRYLQQDHPISIQKQSNFSCCAKITTKDYYCKLFNPFYGIHGCCMSKRTPIILDSEEAKFVNSGGTDLLNSTNDDADVLPPPPKPRSQYIELAIQLGEGTVSYLQTMKTLSIAFLLLAIINAPLVIAFFENSEKSFENMNQAVNQFTLGVLGQDSLGCVQAPLDVLHGYHQCLKPKSPEEEKKLVAGLEWEKGEYKNGPEEPHHSYKGDLPGILEFNVLKLSCGVKSRITQFNDFGIMNSNLYGSDTKADPATVCHNINNAVTMPVTFDMFNVEAIKRKQAYEKENKIVLNPFNIDDDCSFFSLFRDTSFKTKFAAYMKKSCIGQSSCWINLNKMFEFESVVSQLSCTCRDKILEGAISQHLMAIYQCESEPLFLPAGWPKLFGEDATPTESAVEQQDKDDDEARVPISKAELVAHLACFDMASVVILMFFMYKLIWMNYDKGQEIADSVVQLKDHSVMLQGVPLDGSSQDERIIKMKLWLAVQDQMEKSGIAGSQVLDVNIQTVKSSSLNLLPQMKSPASKMEAIRINMAETEAKKIPSGRAKLEKLNQEYEKINGILEPMAQQYNDALYQETISGNSLQNFLNRVPRGQRQSSLDYAFVTFKNQEQASLMLQQKKLELKLTNNRSKDLIKEVSLHEALESEQMSMSVATTSRRCCNCLSTLFTFLFHLVFLALILAASLYFQHQQATAAPSTLRCPPLNNFRWFSEFKQQTYYEFLTISQPSSSSADLKLGDLNCFCKYINDTYPAQLETITFTEFNAKDTTKYCALWKERLPKKPMPLQEWHYVGFVVILNFIVSAFMSRLNTCRNVQYYPGTSTFRAIVFHEIFNLGVVIYVTSILNTADVQILDFKGKQSVFKFDWQLSFSFFISAALAVSIVSSHLWELLIYPCYPAYRCCYKYFGGGFRCSCSCAAYPDEERCTTMVFNQRQLNKIYDEDLSFSLERAVARMTSFLFIVIVFSTTMPVLYAFGFVYVWLTYIFHKVLILKARRLKRGIKSEIITQAFVLLLLALVIRIAHGFIIYNDKMSLRSWSAVNPQNGDSWKAFETYVSSTSFTVKDEFEVLADRFTLDLGGEGDSSTASSESSTMQRINLFQLIECACFLVFSLAMLIRACVQNHNCCKKQEKQHREKPVQVQEMEKKGNDDEEQNAGAADDGNEGADDGHRSAEMSGGEEQSHEMTNHNLLREMSLEGLGNFYHRSWNELQQFRGLFNKETLSMDISEAEDLDVDLTGLAIEGDKATHQTKVSNLKSSPNRQTLMEMLCHVYGTSESDINRYEAFLEERLNMIGLVIEEHFHSYLPVLILRQVEKKNNKMQSFKDALYSHYSNMTAAEKVKLLVGQEQTLIELNINERRRQGLEQRQSIFRLKGAVEGQMAQTYFIFDRADHRGEAWLYYALNARLMLERHVEDMQLIRRIESQEERLKADKNLQLFKQRIRSQYENQVRAAAPRNESGLVSMVALAKPKAPTQLAAIDLTCIGENQPDQQRDESEREAVRMLSNNLDEDGSPEVIIDADRVED